MFREQVEFVLIKKGMKKAQLADKLKWSKSNLYNKLGRNNFTEREMREIAEALDCTLNISITINETGETF